ncbi:MAG: hypothetical protein B7Z70_00855, partial [Acidithiobacillus ferrivorans]
MSPACGSRRPEYGAPPLLGAVVHIHQKPKRQLLPNQTAVHKTFHIMPKPIRSQAPSPTKPRVAPLSRSAPHRVVHAAH